MKSHPTFSPTRERAFTLIELLVVIAIIAILAALIFPAGAALKRGATIKKVQTELQQVETAINSYKAKYGHFPPDGSFGPIVNPLYFELLGTTNNQNSGEFVTTDGGARIRFADMQTTFGVGGFVNCTKGGGDEGTPAVKFLSELKPGQYGEIASGGSSVRLLACSVSWPDNLVYQPTSTKTLNPWRYNSSSPVNNSGAYDLWVDILIGGKTNRISNWSKQPQSIP